MALASAEKHEHTEPSEKERVALAHIESSWQVCQSHLCQKEKKQSRLFRASDRKAGESQGEQSRDLTREGRIRA